MLKAVNDVTKAKNDGTLALPGEGSYRGLKEDKQELAVVQESGATDQEWMDDHHYQAKMRAEIRSENLALCRSIMIFMVYLGVFTVSMFLESSDSSSRFADHMRQMLSGGGSDHHAKMTISRVNKPLDLYDFLEQTFVPTFWQNNTDTNQAMAQSTYLHPIDSTNRMLGSARVRQVRVANTPNCHVAPMFAEYTINCYPTFLPGGIMTPSNEDTNAFGPEGKFTHSGDPLGTGYAGSVGQYPAGGFMEFLSVNRTLALMAIQTLKSEDFFDLQTRAVFVDFTVWNSNIGVYSVMRIAFEFGPSGTVHQYLEISVLSESMLKLGGHGNLGDWCALFGVMIVMLFVVYFLIEEMFELNDNRLAYFMDGWNVLDWVNMMLLIIAFINRVMVYADASTAALGAAQLVNPDSFSSIRGLAAKAEQVKLLHSFNAVLLWSKCVKYTKHLPVVKVLVKTIWNAFALFLPLMFMFLLALIGFTMAYNIGFGDKIQELTTFTRAIVYLSRSFLRDVKLMPVYYITPVFGAFLILLFYVMLVLVGLQLLFAIVADAMYRAKQYPEEPDAMHKDEPLEEVLREMKKYGIKIIRACCPIIYRNFIKKPMSYEERQRIIQQAKDGQEYQLEQMALKNAADARSESTYSMSTVPGEKSFTTAEIMLAIQHMSGRVLSEVQEVGIEIRSELHDVCERVAQMQMAVEELSWRSELVRREQESIPQVAREQEGNT